MTDGSGRTYYIDHNTGTTHWTLPQSIQATDPPPSFASQSTATNQVVPKELGVGARENATPTTSSNLILAAKDAVETASEQVTQPAEGLNENENRISNYIKMMKLSFNLKDYNEARKYANTVVQKIADSPADRRPWSIIKFEGVVKALDAITPQIQAP